MDFADIFSLSTAWNAKRHTSGKRMIEEIKAAGFKKVELNYNVTGEMAGEIMDLVEAGDIEVSSIHNVFPKVFDKTYDTDSMLLGYPDPEKRKRSVELTIGSVEYAARFNARVVVIHPGEVPVSKNYNKLLEDLIIQGKRNTAEYDALYREMLEVRETGSPAYVELIRQSVEEICEHIAKKGYNVVLGLENRTRCYQIPVFHEVHTLLDRLKGLPVYFWYDVGHGMLLEQMGMFDNRKEALQVLDRTIGVHIHDIVGCDDHFCPYIFTDKIDKYLDIINEIPIKVMEIGSDSKAEDIARSAEILASRLEAFRIE